MDAQVLSTARASARHYRAVCCLRAWRGYVQQFPGPQQLGFHMVGITLPGTTSNHLEGGHLGSVPRLCAERALLRAKNRHIAFVPSVKCFEASSWKTSAWGKSPAHRPEARARAAAQVGTGCLVATRRRAPASTNWTSLTELDSLAFT